MDARMLREHARAGATMAEVARSLGVAPGTVRWWVIGHRLDGLFAANVARRYPTKITSSDYPAMRSLYERELLSVYEVAQVYGASYTTAHKHLGRAGVAFRPPLAR